MCLGQCEDPSSGLSQCASACGGPDNMVCGFAPTGQAASVYPIPGWNNGVVACKRHADCQTAFILNSLTCETSIQFDPMKSTNMTWVQVYNDVETVSESSSAISTSLRLDLSQNSAEAVKTTNTFSQSEFSPICKVPSEILQDFPLDHCRSH